MWLRDMALVFLVNPQTPLSSGRPDDLQKEWQECRNVIGRLDGTLVDLRKYGFGLASTLLTANGVLGGIANLLPKSSTGASFTVPSGVIASLVTVTMVLVLVLFVIDRWYSVLQWGAVNRARAIELILSLDTTREIQRWAQREGLWKVVALIQYGSFVVVSLGLGVAVLGWDAVPSPTHGAANLMAGAAVICLVLIVVVHITANREWEKLMGDPPSPARGIVTHSIRLTREGVKANDTADYVVAVSPALSQAARALAVVKPSDQPGLSIVGCEVLPPDRVKVTLANSQPAPIIPSDEDLQLITYF
jgi:hypothetical protein